MYINDYSHTSNPPRDAPLTEFTTGMYKTTTWNEVISNTPDRESNMVYTHGLKGVNEAGNYFYIESLVIFFFGLCFLTVAVRWTRMANNHLRHLVTIGREKQAYWRENRTHIWPWIKRHILFAPLWNKRHNHDIQLSSAVSIGTLPSRLHMVLIVLYIVSNIAYCCILDYGQPDRAVIIAELRGRSGALAAFNLIPTILFALRNNPFIYLLRVSYDTFNLFHRYAARVVVLESLVHSIAWAANAVEVGGWSSAQVMLTPSVSFKCGMTATALFVFIVIQAWSPVRHAFYETFINLHRLFALLALIMVYIHLDTGKLPQLPYLQLVLALWILEYAARSTWIIYYNFGRGTRTTVFVEALPNEACRVTFHLARSWKFRPGCHIHAYIPSIGLWSSHPFSVAWAEGHAQGEIDEKLPSHSSMLEDHPKNCTSMSLVVRARTGMTNRLFIKAIARGTSSFTTTGFIEGPYGGHESLDSYGTVLLFAAGVGITHQVGYVAHLLRGYESSTISTRKIILVWSIPNADTLEWVRPWMDQVLKMKARRHVLKVMLFVSKPKTQDEVRSGTGTVLMFPGRCEPQAIVDREITERQGAMAVTVCGPGAFSDTVRAAVRRRVQVGNVDFIEEAFTY